MKRIRVPAEMLNFAMKASMDAGLPIGPSTELSVVVEAVLLYISEHPQVPTDEQLESMYSSTRQCWVGDRSGIQRDQWLVSEWQRRCFVQEEPEIPAEIEDLLWYGIPAVDHTQGVDGLHNTLLLAAYRRGLCKGEQK